MLHFPLLHADNPVKISCLYNPSQPEYFLKVALLGEKREEVVKGTADEKEGTCFYIRESPSTSPDHEVELSIALYDSHSRYLVTNSKYTGKSDGPLKFENSKSTHFILEKENNEPANDWERDSCHVRVVPSDFQRKCYLCFNEETMNLMCRPTIEKEYYYQFKIKRIHDIIQERLKNFTPVSMVCGCEDRKWLPSTDDDNSNNMPPMKRRCNLLQTLTAAIK